MAGVAIRLPNPRGDLGAWAERLRTTARTFEREAGEIIKEELEAAVASIKRISPVKTGLFRRSWKVQRRNLLTFAVVDTAPYAEWVHRRGERGLLFWETYAMPEVMAGHRRAIMRIRDMLRAKLTSATSPATVLRSRSLLALGRVRL